MKRFAWLSFLGCVLLLFATGSAYAWHVEGLVVCDSNGDGRIDANDLPLANVRVTVVSTGVPYGDGTTSRSGLTDANGFYVLDLPDAPTTFNISIDVTTLPASSTVVSPASNPFAGVSVVDVIPRIDWLIASPTCRPKACWLTGGGGKFSSVTGTSLAERGPQHSFGGNVYPGCSPDAGEGGQWNHVAHAMKLHFQAFEIQVVQCGNVADHPPGSESPVTPFNFIEFRGTGRLKGIHGNRDDFGTVEFFAHVQDRNEPGSNGAKDGALVDRYYLHVFDGSGTLLLVDVDGDPSTIDPVTITDGNMQLHISSCSNPPQ